MPRPFRGLFAAAATLLTTALAGSLPAPAEMTEDDRAGQRTFAACLDENGGDEAVCVEKLSLYAWYPANDKTCAMIGARVERVISLDGQPKWSDLFRNERCARLGMPHGEWAARAGARWDPEERYARCDEFDSYNVSCIEVFGQHAWHPYKEKICQSTVRGLTKQVHKRKAGKPYFRDMLFETERCRRLGLPYFTLEGTQ